MPLNQDKKESIEAAAAAAEELLGDLPVDYIINNAAYVSPSIHLSLHRQPSREEGLLVRPDEHLNVLNVLNVHLALGI